MLFLYPILHLFCQKFTAIGSVLFASTKCKQNCWGLNIDWAWSSVDSLAFSTLVNALLFLVLWVFFGKNRDIFMAVICNMAKGGLADCRYFVEIVNDWINTDFMRNKVASSYIQMIFIVCCFLLTAPSKGKIINVLYVTDGIFWTCITMWLVQNRN